VIKNRAEPKNLDTTISSHRRNLTAQLLLQYDIAQDLELALDISVRWTPSNPQWQEAVALRHNHELQCTIDNLERLCLERMFELEKCLQGNIGG
jgi:hypothetical protein